MNFTMGESSIIDTGVLQRNPFPGVRPFTSAEDKYFFGRDEVINEVKDTLLVNHFVALIGASGTGKTSVIQSGIIPELLTSGSGEWVPVSVRPGTNPLENLLKGFQQVFPTDLSDDDVQAFISGDMSLGEWVSQTIPGKNNYLIVVDQFEEIFRMGHHGRPNGKNPEASRLVKLLMQVVNEKLPDFYVILSIRSDFIDNCSKYIDLTEQINRSKYLLPGLSGDAIASVIRGPIKLAGAEIEPGFVDLLLDDLKEVEEQLPLLQHSLMRTWDHWTQKRSNETPISVSDYLDAGPIGKSLNDQLNDIYNSLDEKQKVICERLFKTITAKGEQTIGYRRLISLGNIARIAQCSVDEVSDVVSIFRRPGRQFLLPSANHALTEGCIIELAHESLITTWEMLRKWIEEEAESIRIYMKLSEASELYQQGRTELWKHPELQHAIEWRESQKPTPSWGIQYNPAFERAMVFLNTSEEEYQWDEERKVLRQRRKLIINRTITIGLSVAVVILGLVFWLGRNRPVQQDTPVNNDGGMAVLNPGEPAQGSDAVSGAEETTLPGDETTEGTATEENPAPLVPDEGPGTDPVQEIRSQPETRPREQDPGEVREQSPPARETKPPAGRTGQQTRTSSPTVNNAALKREAIVQAKNVARASVDMEGDPDLQGLLAYQAYQLNRENNGNYFDADIYNGLYKSLKKLISSAYNIYPNMRNSVKSIVWLRSRNSMVVASNDGSVKILPGDVKNKKNQTLLTNTNLTNEDISVSPDESVLAVGTSGGGLLFIDMRNGGKLLHKTEAEGKIILLLQNLGKGGSFISAGTDTRILRWNYRDYKASLLVDVGTRPSALAASSNGSKVAVGTRDGKLYELNPERPEGMKSIADFGTNSVRAAVYSPGGQFLAAGLLDGSVRILAGEKRATLASLKGPGSRVSDLAYSPDGRFLAAASNDGNVYLWNTSDWNQPPLVFSENKGFILAVCFSHNSNNFYSGSTDFPRLIGRPSESAQMVKEFCDLLGRNLTQAEWNQYFGDSQPYRKTCPNL